MNPKICVTLQALNISKIIKTIKRLEPLSPDLIEIRFDYSKKDINPYKIVEVTKIPLIATARIKNDGGLWKKPEKDRINLLINACNSGFSYVDLEASTPNILNVASDLQSTSSKLIISYHDFNKTPTIYEMEEMYTRAKNSGCSICKIVGNANNYYDNIVYLEFLKNHPGNIAFGMSTSGVLSRIISPLVGGEWTYASPNQHEAVAPGQLPLERLRRIYELMELHQ
ncbi:type I 3-dehydroquinate dehydratase [Candidatus Bathyarchaeota archaeon]|nr:type I 3-dehydroquinate dehydratase [Candidatus Bathyarchaeota archaeon]